MWEGGRGMNAKQYAEQLYNKYYAIIFEYGEEMSQEVVVSILAKKCAIQAVNEMIISLADDFDLNYLQQIIKELEQL